MTLTPLFHLGGCSRIARLTFAEPVSGTVRDAENGAVAESFRYVLDDGVLSGGKVWQDGVPVEWGRVPRDAMLIRSQAAAEKGRGHDALGGMDASRRGAGGT